MKAPAGLAAADQLNRAGHTVTEQHLTDGAIKLTIQVGGAP